MKYQASNDFWGRRIRQVYEKMIPLQLSILKDEAPDTAPSHAIENFRIAAGLSQGEYYGMVFQDSDVGKWIEASSYKLMAEKDEALEKEIDAIVEIMGKAQQPDGYLNTYYTLKEPGKRWTNVCECHELYCFGHLTEGAVAYHQATGKTAFLDIMCRMADHIADVFGPEPGKIHGYPGHPEAELALYRLYRETGERKYLDLGFYFINERGRKPNFFDEEREKRGGGYFWKERPRDLDLTYYQAHLPVREQREATGHAVRALYLYTAMACMAKEMNDPELAGACVELWNDAVNRKMYITGGLGATEIGEAFMGDYELPNDTAYAETCASVALCFFGKAMWGLLPDGIIDDAVEKELYNVILSGISLQADRFYYVNPMEAIQGVSGKQQGHRHVLPVRQKWFQCACCPPNAARLIASLPEYAFEEKPDSVTVHQYLGGTVELEKAVITLETDYPWNGLLKYTIEAKKAFELRLRIPGWADRQKISLTLNGKAVEIAPEGYVSLPVGAGTNTIVLMLPIEPKRSYAHPKVRQAAGCTALSFGPVVYCLEGCDNPEPLWNLYIDRDAALEVSDYLPDELGGIRWIFADGYQRIDKEDATLYSGSKPEFQKVRLNAIPYYAWANRAPRDMRVWINTR